MTDTTNNVSKYAMTDSERANYELRCTIADERFALDYVLVQREQVIINAKKALQKQKRQQTRVKNGTEAQYATNQYKRKQAEMRRDNARFVSMKIMCSANELFGARVKYETETLARSNDELYAILSGIYGLFERAVAEKCVRNTVAAMREEMKKREVRVQSNTNAITLFVRFVFNSDRKRAYNYASTLMAAMEAGVSANNLAAFIEASNGVEECKRTYRKTTEAKSKELALENAELATIDELRSVDAVQTVQLADGAVELATGAEFIFVIARKNANGDIELLQVVNKTTLAMQKLAVSEIAKHKLANSATLAGAVIAKAKVDADNSVIMVKKNAADIAKMTMGELELTE
jgi:hypothetical protein